MRVSLHAALNRKTNEYQIGVRLHVVAGQLAKLSVTEALDVAMIAYANANAMLAERVERAAKQHRKPPRHIDVKSYDTDEMPPELVAAIGDLLGPARATKPEPKLEEVRTMMHAALLQRYADCGVTPPSESLAKLQRGAS